jgi:hypothetical protein
MVVVCLFVTNVRFSDGVLFLILSAFGDSSCVPICAHELFLAQDICDVTSGARVVGHCWLQHSTLDVDIVVT